MNWSIEYSKQLYSMKTWSDGYFDIDQNGQVVVYPQADKTKPWINIQQIAGSIADHGLTLPVLVRFIDILEHRVNCLIEGFSKARLEFDYQGDYFPVYPIKVNQQKPVIDGILQNNSGVVGLEAGSRAELIAIIALSDGGPIVCNGYKDKTYIRLALMAMKMGLKVFLVIEKLSELKTILQEADSLGIEPQLGVRIRLSNIGDNRWQNSGGEKSKFGLSSSHLLAMVEQLSQCNCIHWLKMMHFHIGSQVTSLESFERGLKEAGRFHAELHQLGARITTLDVGGGLAVDYEGSASTDFCSMNYSIESYAQTIVRCVKQTCEQYNLPVPDLLTESGRAMTAHHSVLIANVVDVECLIDKTDQNKHDLADDIDADPLALKRSVEKIQASMCQARTDYTAGLLGLAQLADAESSGYYQLQQIRDRLKSTREAVKAPIEHETEQLLNEKLADKVFCNFSLFQSMPDVWAFQQRFPIMPLSRLDEEPCRRGVIQDLTCDSDGSITHYVEQYGIESTMPIHQVTADEEYYLGFFLLGAYQEILGDMHNLFGDVDAINIHIDEQGHSHYYSPDKGDTVADLLRYVHIEPDQVLEYLQLKLDNADLETGLKQEIETMFKTTLQTGTYLEQSQ